MADIVERLRIPSDTEEVMKHLRAYLLEGKKGSYARDIFEALLSHIDEEREEAADEIERVRGERDEWRKDFGTLCKAVVGETGLSAIEEAARIRNEVEYLNLEMEGVQNGKMELAKLLGCEDEPRWKWLRLGIIKLKRRIDKLEKALEPFANSDMRFAYETGHVESLDSCVAGVCDFTVGDLLDARAALEDKRVGDACGQAVDNPS